MSRPVNVVEKTLAARTRGSLVFNMQRLMMFLFCVCAFCSAFGVSRAEDRFPFLKAGGKSYTNVIVTGKGASDVFILHAGGMATQLRTWMLPPLTRLGIALPTPQSQIPATNQFNAENAPPAEPETGRTLHPATWYVAIGVFGVVVISFPFYRRLSRQAESPSLAEPHHQIDPSLGDAPASRSADELRLIVDGEGSLRGLMPHFGDPVRALEYYGSEMQKKCSAAKQPDVCAGCEKRASAVTEFYEWNAFVRPRFRFTRLDALLLFLGRLGFTLEHTVVSFYTTHHFCAECSKATRIKRGFSVLIKALAFLLLLIGLGLTIICGGAVLMMRNSASMADDSREMLIAFVIGVICVVLSISGHQWEKVLRIPPPLRKIGRRPFLLAKVTRV